MTFRARSALLSVLLLTTPLATAALAEEALLKQPGRWAQDYTGRAADPAIRFGTLPNGLRYAIMRNQTPSDGVAMRLRIGAGSNQERDEEQGLAHFLEHMAFRGSTNVADGETVKMLERQGLRFGPDTNASTAQDETIYMFTFPRADASAIDTGMTLFREIGERLKLDPAAIEAEKGVILSEERLRDVPAYRSAKANFGNALAGTRAVARWPIGIEATIKGATAERMRRFYTANYRPDNATIVVVGNIDPAQIEAQIKARFADWKPAGKPDAIDLGEPAPARPAAEFVAPGAQDLVTLAWVRPRDQRAETEAVDREALLRFVGLTVLNNRLADRAGKPGSPFVASQAAEVPTLFGVAGLTQLAIVGTPDKWREALEAATEEQRQLLAGGVTPGELQRAVTQVQTIFQVQAANATTRTSAAIADSIVQTVNKDEIVTSPAQDFAFAAPLLAAMKPAEVDAALKLAFSGKGPVLFRSAQANPLTAPVLEQALAAAYARPLTARAAEAAVVWPYGDFGKPSVIVSRSEDKALGTTTVTFGNGSRLIVKPTAFEKDTIHVSVSFGNGRKGADPALAHALWAVELVPLGGTGKLSIGDVTRWAQSSGKVINARMTAGYGAFTLAGRTRPEDLKSQLQLLAALARDPGFRPELGDKLGAMGPMLAGQFEANAGTVFTREMQRLAAGGDARFAPLPTAADLTGTKPADLPALLRPAFAGPADVTIVGDVGVAEAIAFTLATFGAGPEAARAPVPAVRVGLPAGREEPYTFTHNGRADQANYGEYWPLPDYFADPKLSYVADVAASVLRARLVDTVREKLGLTYSPRAEAVSGVELAGQGYFGAAIETPAANFAAFRKLLDEQVAELAAKPVGADELDRARKPLVEARSKDFESNAYWLAQLPLVLRDPRLKTPVLKRASGIAAVSAADVQGLFQRHVAGKLPVTVIAKAK